MGCNFVEENKNIHWCNDVEITVEHENEKYCIFHAPVDCQEKLDKWDNDLVHVRVDRAKREGSVCDLTGTIFPEAIHFGGNRQGGKPELPGIRFDQATFSHGVSFYNVIFRSHARFRNATFKSFGTFSHATFSIGVDFLGAIFTDDAYFYKTIFSGRANFINATFKVDKELPFVAMADFTDATFSSRANFDRAKFGSNAIFCSTHFADNSFFDYVKFHYVDFSQTKFEQSAFFRRTVFNYGQFTSCIVTSHLEFDRAELNRLSLLGAPIESIRFSSCEWPKTNNRNVIYDARQVKMQGYFKIDNLNEDRVVNPVKFQDWPTPIHLEDLFRRLKKVAKIENDEMMASDWHYNEKEMQRQRFAEPDTNLTCSDKVRKLILRLILEVYKKVSGYGEEPLRAVLCLMWLIVLPFFCDWIVITPWEPFPGESIQYLPLVKSDLPTVAPLWVAFWQLLITVQAALFGFALRNKFRR